MDIMRVKCNSRAYFCCRRTQVRWLEKSYRVRNAVVTHNAQTCQKKTWNIISGLWNEWRGIGYGISLDIGSAYPAVTYYQAGNWDFPSVNCIKCWKGKREFAILPSLMIHGTDLATYTLPIIADWLLRGWRELHASIPRNNTRLGRCRISIPFDTRLFQIFSPPWTASTLSTGLTWQAVFFISFASHFLYSSLFHHNR